MRVLVTRVTDQIGGTLVTTPGPGVSVIPAAARNLTSSNLIALQRYSIKSEPI